MSVSLIWVLLECQGFKIDFVNVVCGIYVGNFCEELFFWNWMFLNFYLVKFGFDL